MIAMSRQTFSNAGESGAADFMAARAVTIAGQGAPPLIFLHGFGADQSVWRHVAPAFIARHEVVTYDHMGSGQSLSAGQDHRRYQTLDGYAEDLATLLDLLELRSSVVVGHSVSGMIGMLAARRTDRISALVTIASSPRYLDAPGYVGGFGREQVDDLLSMMELDLQGWAQAMARAAMSDTGRPDLVDELAYGFVHANPELLRNFARATFLSDNRQLLADCRVPTLVLQPQDDTIVPWAAAEYLANSLPSATLRRLSARGHYPQLSAAPEVVQEITAFLAKAAG